MQRRGKRTLWTMGFLVLLAGCGQSQEQSVAISSSDLGLLSVKLLIDVPGGATIGLDGFPAQGTHHIDCCGGCPHSYDDVIWDWISSDSIYVDVELLESSTSEAAIEACEDSFSCTTEASGKLSSQGEATFSGLLVGKYRVEIGKSGYLGCPVDTSVNDSCCHAQRGCAVHASATTVTIGPAGSTIEVVGSVEQEY